MVVAYFVPEVGSAAHLYFDLSRALVRMGHEVHVITTYPRDFNLPMENDGEVPINEEIEGIIIHRVIYNNYRDSIFLRGIEHYTLWRKYLQRALDLKIEFDSCIIYLPPLSLAKFSRELFKEMGVKSILNFQDFHPQ